MLVQGSLALQSLCKHLTGIMSQYNSVHQHHDSAAAHTCFLTQGCKDEPLACFQLLQNVPPANRRSSLKDNLQIWRSQPANGWKTLSHAWCQNLRHKLLSATGAALRVMHVSNTVLGKRSEYYICGCTSPQPVYSESHSNQSQSAGTTQTKNWHA